MELNKLEKNRYSGAAENRQPERINKAAETALLPMIQENEEIGGNAHMSAGCPISEERAH